MNKYAYSFVRHGLTFVGGVLAAGGFLSDETSQKVVEEASGPVAEIVTGFAIAGIAQIASFINLAKISKYLPKF